MCEKNLESGGVSLKGEVGGMADGRGDILNTMGEVLRGRKELGTSNLL